MQRHTILESLSDNIVIDKNKCTFCSLCVNRCILDNLRMALAPCSNACPMKVNSQGYVQLILRGEDDAAREMVRRNLPFPEIISRICHHPCEAACHRMQTENSAVSIKALKRYLFDNLEGEEPPLPEMGADTGRKAAIVGSGPAGLSAAYYLRVQGHAVTVFESGPEPGGLMATAIPEFRLPAQVVRREVHMLERMGVTFKCGVTVGGDVTLSELGEDHDAVILATGLGGQRRLGVPGENLEGVYRGLDLLRAAKAGDAPELSGRVLVVGGGNAAVDAALVARRLGASEVALVSLESRDALPAFEAELEQAQREGVELICGYGVTSILEKNGRAAGLMLSQCTQVFDECGCFAPVLCHDNAAEETADAVVVVIGQQADTSVLKGASLTQADLTGADSLTRQIGDGKLFVAGDCRTGPGSAIVAMADGREAAESAHRLMTDQHLAYNRAYAGPVEPCENIDTSRGSDRKRVQPTMRDFSGKGDYAESEVAYSPDQAREEASRCYSCGGPFGKYRTCWFCLPCEVSCPNDALWVEIPYLLR